MTGLSPRERGPTFAQIQAAFMAHRPLDADTTFFDAGFSSATLAEVLAALRGLGLTLSLTDLYQYPTVRELATALQVVTASAPPPWLRPAGGLNQESR